MWRMKVQTKVRGIKTALAVFFNAPVFRYTATKPMPTPGERGRIAKIV